MSNKPELKLDINKTFEFLMQEAYFSTFEIIDNLNQQPRGMNFYEWLLSKKLISRENYEEIQEWLDLNTKYNGGAE